MTLRTAEVRDFYIIIDAIDYVTGYETPVLRVFTCVVKALNEQSVQFDYERLRRGEIFPSLHRHWVG